jgi:hypothetical protein
VNDEKDKYEQYQIQKFLFASFLFDDVVEPTISID